MTSQPATDPPHTPVSSPRETLGEVYERALGASTARSQYVRVRSGLSIHLLEAGQGPAVVHLHGSNTCALSHLPLLERLVGVRSLAVDRPGFGLSEPAAVRPEHFRESAIGFVDEVLDALRLDSPVLAGASMGGLWALWYAVARPERVRRLVLLGSVPLLPETRAPGPLRAMATPVVGDVVARRIKPARSMVIRMMRSVGEAETIVRHPALLDSLVAGGRDPVASAANLAELRAIISPFGLRPSMRILPAELRRLSVPTLLVWGDHDPVGSVEAARAAARLIPDAQLEVLPAGHVPWLGHPDRVSEVVAAFAGRGAN